MADRILIRFSDDQFEWLAVNSKGRPLSGVGRGNGEELVTACQNKEVVLLVPGSDVLLTNVTIPTRNTTGIARALPYAVEEQLAEDVDLLHFARGEQDAEGAMPVAVIRRQCLDQYLGVLTQLRIYPASAYAAPLLLPQKEDVWSVLVEDEKALLRYGSDQGLELNSDSLLPIVGRLLKEYTGDGRPKLKVWYSGDVAPDMAQLELTGCEVDVSPVPETGMAMMASTLVVDSGLDLLQGEYRQQNTASLMTFKPWRMAVSFLVLAGLIQLGGVGYSHWQLIAEDKKLAQEIESLYREAFPEAGKIIRGSERQQAGRKLAELRQQHGRGSDTFLALLHISGTELNKDKNLRLEGLNYKGGALNLRLQGSDLSQFEVFKQKLVKGREQDIEVEVLSAVSRKKGVDGRIMIKERK